jgi:hypothetical protein
MSEAPYVFVQCDANGCEKSDGLKICELRRRTFCSIILQHMTSCVMCCFSSYILLLCSSSEC